jgi:tetratricopeptide (TPR) repeat protein
VAFKYIFNISLEKAYLGFIPDLPRNLSYEPGYVFQLFKFCLPLLILAFLLLQRVFRKKNAGKTQTAELENKSLSDAPEHDPKIPAVVHSSAPVMFLNIAIILILSFLVLEKTRNSAIKNVVLVDYYTYTGQWNNAIRTSLAEPIYSVSINYNYNRAIDQKGVFIDKFFDFPQRVGPNILPPNKNKGAVISIICSDYYYDLGYMSEAMHWAHEAHTLLPYSPRVLKRMVKVNLIIGNYKTAGKYLNVLGENFLNRKFVAAYSPYIEDTALITRDKEIIAKRALLPHGFVVEADNTFHQLLSQNPDNKRAFEHMMVRYLLEHDLETFLNTINIGKKFYTAGTPSLYQEAYMIYLLEHNPSAVSASKLDARNENTLKNYSRIMKKYNNNTEAAKAEMQKYIGDTYLYYLLYYRPGN